MSGYDLLGPEPALPPGAVSVKDGDYEAARIEAGFPRHGAELDERTIPAEAGLVEASVSFTKGCYTGQELVARINSAGATCPATCAPWCSPGLSARALGSAQRLLRWEVDRTRRARLDRPSLAQRCRSKD